MPFAPAGCASCPDAGILRARRRRWRCRALVNGRLSDPPDRRAHRGTSARAIATSTTATTSTCTAPPTSCSWSSAWASTRTSRRRTRSRACARSGKQRVLRASKELGDRMDTTVGPFRDRGASSRCTRCACIAESTEHPLAFDLTWTGAIPAFEEPQHFIRSHGRVHVRQPPLRADRLLGRHDRGRGRDRSRSRPTAGRARATARGACGRSARPSPPGIREGDAVDGRHVELRADAVRRLLDPLHRAGGARPATRALEEAVRIWNDPARGHEWLGRPEFEHTLEPGTRMIRKPSTTVVPRRAGRRLRHRRSRRCATRTSRSAPATAWTTTGATACTRARSSCSTGSTTQEELESWGWYGVVDHVAALRDEHRRRRLRPPRARLLRPVPQVRPRTQRRRRARLTSSPRVVVDEVVVVDDDVPALVALAAHVDEHVARLERRSRDRAAGPGCACRRTPCSRCVR